MLAYLIWIVQNVIDRKDQMTFKVLLITGGAQAPRWGAIQIPKNEKSENAGKSVRT